MQMKALSSLIDLLAEVDLITFFGVLSLVIACIWFYLWSKKQNDHNPK